MDYRRLCYISAGCVTAGTVTAVWPQSAHSVSLRTGSSLGMHTNVRWVTQRTSLPVTSIWYLEIQEALAWVSPKMPPGTECLLVSGNRILSLCLGFDPYFLLSKECAAPWPRAHDRHKDLLFQNPYPLTKYPHSRRTPVPFLQMKAHPSKGTCNSLFPKCRHSILLVMEKPRDSG